MRKDHKAVKDYIAQGIDVELRAGPEESRLLMEMWRGPRCRGEVYFFHCNHPEESLRPMAIHFAILLNYPEVLAEIVHAKVLPLSI